MTLDMDAFLLLLLIWSIMCERSYESYKCTVVTVVPDHQ